MTEGEGGPHLAIATQHSVSLDSLNCPWAQARPGGSSDQRTRNDSRKGRGWLHEWGPARGPAVTPAELPLAGSRQSAGAALCSAPRGKHRVNHALCCRTSWNPEYADALCESIKRGCLVQRFPNLFDHRNLFYFYFAEITALHSLKPRALTNE